MKERKSTCLVVSMHRRLLGVSVARQLRDRTIIKNGFNLTHDSVESVIIKCLLV